MNGSEKRTTRADREAAAEILNRHYAAGTLDDDEYNERLDAAMEAKWPHELAPLLTDLPRLQENEVTRPDPRKVPDSAQADNRHALQNVLALATSIVVVTVAAIVFSGHRNGGGPAYGIMVAGCSVIGALTGWRKKDGGVMALIGFLSGVAPIAGTLLMIFLTWRRDGRLPLRRT